MGLCMCNCNKYEKTPFVCAGAISGIAVAGAVALVLLVLFIPTFACTLHLILKVRKQNRKLQWSDVIEEVNFIVQVRFDIKCLIVV